MFNIMIFGAGDVGTRFAEALLLRDKVRKLTLVDLPEGGGAGSAEMLASCYLSPIHFEGLDAMDVGAVEKVVRRHRPDLVIQAAALRSPFAVMMADHPVAHALHAAGMAVQLGYQFPILYSVMRGVRAADPDVPVANVSFPDLSHYILNAKDLAPTAGLANTGIIQMRIATNLLRKQILDDGDLEASVRQVRVIGGHALVYGVLFGQRPERVEEEPLVYLEGGDVCASEIVYSGADLQHCPNPNMTTAAASMPVIEALLPDAPDCQTSMPGPLGMRGGYPVVISKQKVELDLPASITLEEAEEFNIQAMRLDGVERVESDGTVYYTEAAKIAMAEVEPQLTEPYNPLTDSDRTSLILGLVDSIR